MVGEGRESQQRRGAKGRKRGPTHRIEILTVGRKVERDLPVPCPYRRRFRISLHQQAHSIRPAVHHNNRERLTVAIEGTRGQPEKERVGALLRWAGPGRHGGESHLGLCSGGRRAALGWWLRNAGGASHRYPAPRPLSTHTRSVIEPSIRKAAGHSAGRTGREMLDEGVDVCGGELLALRSVMQRDATELVTGAGLARLLGEHLVHDFCREALILQSTAGKLSEGACSHCAQ